MIQKWSLVVLVMFLNMQTTVAQVLMEVPLLMELPGKKSLVRAWYDGESFYIDGQDLFENLKFSVQISGSKLIALDAHHRYEFDCGGVQANDGCKLPLHEVLDQLEPMLYFDETRLHLRASSAATMFENRSIRNHSPSWAEVPGPHLFGRNRKMWGGMMASWQVRRDQFGVRPSVKMTASALKGTVEGKVGNGFRWNYSYDWPDQSWLTQIKVEHLGQGASMLSFTNLPLIRPRLQHFREITGQSAPHALLQAVISGEVVDQVQADAEGKYRLHAPLWYGSSKMQIRSQSLGGVEEISRVIYQLTPESLLPPRKMYFQGHISQDIRRLHLQYGLYPKLTLQTEFEQMDQRLRISSGAILSPLSYLSLHTTMHLPDLDGELALQLWRPSVQVTAHLRARRHKLLNSSLTASASRGAWTMVVRGRQIAFGGQSQRLSIHPELWLHDAGGLLVHVRYEATRTYRNSSEHRFYSGWRVATGWAFSQARVLAFVNRDRFSHLFGLEGFLILRHQSLSFSIGWEAKQRSPVVSLSLQASSAFGSLFVQSQRDAHGVTHSQHLQGSIQIGHDVRVSPYGQLESAVELRIFEDINGNAIEDPTEPIIPHIEAQIYQGSWTRLRSGSLYSSHLNPYQRYQVRLLEDSMRDPSLHPATGMDFSFTADPGRRKIITVAMQRLIPVTGKIRNIDRAPLRLQIRVNQKTTSDIYQDGGFSLHLHPGEYTFAIVDILTDEILARKTVKVDPLRFHFELDLKEDYP